MKTHDNRVLFSKALLKAATCLFLTAGAGMSPVFALPGTAESMKMEITQQTVTVSGVVKDKKGEPIIGANIMEKGTTNGTITDFDGKYTLKVKSAQSVLTISYIGYKTQEIPVGNGGKKDITMQDDSELMDEVVVIGYGTQRKGDVTSAVASVKAEDFTAGPGIIGSRTRLALAVFCSNQNNAISTSCTINSCRRSILQHINRSYVFGGNRS